MTPKKKKKPLADQAFRDYVVDDLLANFSGISAKAMFGGWGIYQHEKIFALIAEGELFFKTDEMSRTEFEKQGSRPFTYEAKGNKPITLSYWLLPAAAMEDAELLQHFVKLATQVRRLPKPSKPTKR